MHAIVRDLITIHNHSPCQYMNAELHSMMKKDDVMR